MSKQLKVRDIAGKLAIGSAQFGLNYGISNTAGKVPNEELKLILKEARSAGISFIDTARVYGDAESALGPHSSGFNFASKILFELSTKPVNNPGEILLQELEDTLKNLRVEKLHGLMLHRETNLLSPQGSEIWAALLEAKKRGWVDKVGVSSFNPKEFERVLDMFPVEIAQVPVNLFDRRYFSETLRKRYGNIELHGRSLFLQGFFFIKPEALPPFLQFAKSESEKLWQLAMAHGASPAQLSLSYVASLGLFSRLVFAVTSAQELREILEWPLIKISEELLAELEALAKEADPRLPDPTLWQIPPR